MSPRRVKNGTACHPPIPVWVNIRRNPEQYVLCSVIYDSRDLDAARVPSQDEWMKEPWRMSTTECHRSAPAEGSLTICTAWTDQRACAGEVSQTNSLHLTGAWNLENMQSVGVPLSRPRQTPGLARRVRVEEPRPDRLPPTLDLA